MSFIEKAIVLGYEVQDIANVKLLTRGDKQILYIPDNIDCIYGTLKNLKGIIEVQGGKNLSSLINAFSNCRLNSLDLSKLKSDELVDIDGIFSNANIDRVVLGKLENIIYMDEAFKGLDCKYLDLSGLKTDKVISMRSLFNYSIIKEIDINHFDLSSVKDVRYMFSYGLFGEVDIHKLELSKIKNRENIFDYMNVDSEVIMSDRDAKLLKGTLGTANIHDKMVTKASSKKYIQK